MNELILNAADGTVTTIGDSGSVKRTLEELVFENTDHEVRDLDGNVIKAAVVPDVDTLAVEVRNTPLDKDADGKDIPDSRPLLQTHAWRLPKARADRLAGIRAVRNAKLVELDDEANQALTGRPGLRAVADVEAERQVLRDLPPVATAALAQLGNADVIAAYTPPEIE